MTTKRKTKIQREAEQKAALLQRVHDVYSGALGKDWDSDDFSDAETLSRVVPALHDLFSNQSDAKYPWQPHCLHHFDTAEKATEFLFALGFRA